MGEIDRKRDRVGERGRATQIERERKRGREREKGVGEKETGAERKEERGVRER